MLAYIVADVPPSDHQVDKGKTYTHYLLVESVHTPKGPRQHVVCSLGSLALAPREEWLDLAHRLEASLEGQGSLPVPTNNLVRTESREVGD